MTLNALGISPLMVAGGVASSAFGQYTGDGSGAITVALGFTPIWVKVFDWTDGTTYEWSAGAPATDSIKTTNATPPVVSVDTNSAVVSNHNIQSVSSAGVYPPGTQGPGDGTLINTTVEVDSPNLALPQLVLGSVCNVNAKAYTFVALG